MDHFCTKMLTGFCSISACTLTCYIDCTTVYFVKGVIRFWCLSGGVKVQSRDHFCTKMLTDFYSISACPLTCYIDCTTVYFVKGVIRFWCLSGGVKVQSRDHFCMKMLTGFYSIIACSLTCYIDCTTVYFVKGVIRFWCLSGGFKVQSLFSLFKVQSQDHFCTKMLTDFYSISVCPLTCYIDCTTVYFVKGVIRFLCLSGEVEVQSLDHFVRRC